MASEQSSLEPILHEMTHGTLSSGLVSQPPSSTPFVPPTRIDWDILFQLLFDEYFNPPSCVDHTVHESYKEALTESYWIEAMQEELYEFERLKVWELVPRPNYVINITLKWIYKVKLNELGGYLYLYYICISHEHDRLSNGCEDLILEGILREEVYIGQLDEFVDPKNPNHMYKLKKALYGLKQALRACQSKFALESLKKYGMKTCEPVDTPMVEKSKLDEYPQGKAVDHTRYRRMIDTLMYLTYSRPELVFIVCMCTRYQAKPTEKHLHAVKRIFRYLSGTINIDLSVLDFRIKSLINLLLMRKLSHSSRNLATKEISDLLPRKIPYSRLTTETLVLKERRTFYDEEYRKINEEMYYDVNMKLKDAELDDKDKGNEEMADSTQVNDEHTLEQIAVVHVEINPEAVSAQVQDVAQAISTVILITQNETTDVPPSSSSHSVSSNYGSIFLNLKNLQSAKTEIISMLDVKVQHEVLSFQTSTLLTVPIIVIPEPFIIKQSIIVTSTLATTIPLVLPPFFPTLHQSTPIPTPTTIEATTSTPAVPKSKTLSAIHLRVSDLEKKV
uniref:Reverse transcriptase Ty1/copia-type domain-containing protein n=1 Tax=Tanacetum cinerariifolium TaxID=118510 RepID=A0A6L2N8I1_TANCI|nr:hypothetical protein [Tanacetum cinerariifolium]